MRVILGVTGSVAATVVPKLALQLIDAGHELVVVTTEAGRYFLPEPTAFAGVGEAQASRIVPQGAAEPAHALKLRGHEFAPLYGDKDEWPAGGYHKEDRVGHIELRSWADCLVIAPLSANTLAKLAAGMADNFLTCIARAWHKERPLLLAPAMNTTMWLDPVTARQLDELGSRYHRLLLAPPQEKRLACGDTGVGAMADTALIMAQVAAAGENPTGTCA